MGREPVEGRWGMNMRGTVDDNMKPIDDDFRRGIIVKRAKRLFVISAMVSWGVFVGLSFALFYLGPYIRPPPVSFTCPVNSENDLICSGRGACPGVNGTVCLCPISWEGTTCARWGRCARGMVRRTTAPRARASGLAASFRRACLAAKRNQSSCRA